MKKTTILMILDGFGLNDRKEGNAIYEANTPNIDRLMKEYPFVKGYASGLAVGLPDGQMGNSEVGHLNMGAGRIVYQELTRITKSIEDGDFFENEALMAAVNNCREKDSALHLYGLVSDGGVHSHITHIYGLLELAKRNGLKKVYIHAFLDGRDTPPESGASYVKALQEKCKELGVGEIVMISGRYYAMDRDKNYDRTEKAYRALRYGEGAEISDAVEGIEASYKNGITDEFVLPAVVKRNGRAVGTIEDGDSIFFYNFRPDRARQMTHVFCDETFTAFDRGDHRPDVVYVCFTDYDVTIPNKLVAFKKEELKNTLGEYLSNVGCRQARIAETEKYAHVTFFFNGGVEKANPNEDRILVDSPKYVATYDLKPRMSAYTVCDKVCENLVKKNEDGTPYYDLIIVNFANPDMVGHTGVMSAAVKAIDVIDECVGEIVRLSIEQNAQIFLLADHGNSEQMIDYATGEPFTAHTTNPVPFILINADPKYGLREGGVLADVSPTVLELMGIRQPAEMTGKSLLIEK
ncbi:MAG: 2,3-bisphosphoglycerate-independent phosphoglycerate mutase [Lachnospiraceae bacterium]|nr:2,3-bisphosphoglycerate-independent phosphoglycerate mutase [Lachnospiraceae bacterium]